MKNFMKIDAVIAIAMVSNAAMAAEVHAQDDVLSADTEMTCQGVPTILEGTWLHRSDNCTITFTFEGDHYTMDMDFGTWGGVMKGTLVQTSEDTFQLNSDMGIVDQVTLVGGQLKNANKLFNRFAGPHY